MLFLTQLTCANHVVLCDLWWNPAIENQAIDRVHRLGQQKQVSVHRLVIANSIEDRILELQEQKKQLADGVLEGGVIGNRRRQGLSLQDLMKLFRD